MLLVLSYKQGKVEANLKIVMKVLQSISWRWKNTNELLIFLRYNLYKGFIEHTFIVKLHQYPYLSHWVTESLKSLSHQVTEALSHWVTMAMCHWVTDLLSHWVTESLSHCVTESLPQPPLLKSSENSEPPNLLNLM